MCVSVCVCVCAANVWNTQYFMANAYCSSYNTKEHISNGASKTHTHHYAVRFGRVKCETVSTAHTENKTTKIHFPVVFWPLRSVHSARHFVQPSQFICKRIILKVAAILGTHRTVCLHKRISPICAPRVHAIRSSAIIERLERDDQFRHIFRKETWIIVVCNSK